MVRFWQSGQMPSTTRPVAQYPIAGFPRELRVIRCVIGQVHICYAAAEHTPHMVVGVCAQVEAVAVGHDHAVNILLFTQQIQIAVDRSPADMGVPLPDTLIDLLCRGVILPAPNGVQHQLALAGYCAAASWPHLLFSF